MPGAPGVLEFPVPTFLIEHQDGLVLVDTGVSPRADGNEDAVYGTLKPFAVPKMTRRWASTPSRPRSAGNPRTSRTSPSHSHFDHTGSLYLFPHDAQIINSDEWSYIQQQPRGRTGSSSPPDIPSPGSGRGCWTSLSWTRRRQ
jgi:N-acyl homoserine lactone hydrolase